VVGVLALQGNFASHVHILNEIGINSKLVKNREDLSNLDGLILPGGESTTMSNLLLRDKNFVKEIKSFSENMPVFGTCAGLILMSKNCFDEKVLNMGILDIKVHRNAYGRQVHSFEDSIDFSSQNINKSISVSFIRAPKIASIGKNVEIICNYNNEVVGVKEGIHMAVTCHPELQNETFLHEVCFIK
jgi:pyridoxal 5'-phosphate synthase pdxT subunit